MDLAGPERAPFESFVIAYLDAQGDTRRVIADAAIEYFGATVTAGSLVPNREFIAGRLTLAEWLPA